MSEPFIAPSGLAITKEVYTKHCLEQRLLPFLSNKHAHDGVLFWSDKASAHYTRLTWSFYKTIPLTLLKMNQSH